ncbi:hypothetical protein KY290_032684 [Solanum tuberosum]|uniref:Uncharacterized protein n=1 Tax=Solanum tuberosum TaxID=4113 RepID=A0ABQ7UEF2_SOLTU|nr:hypothetical protein KY290_032684 [Solanum tuberosum]
MPASFYKLDQINPRTRPADVPANKEGKGVCYEFLYFILAFNIPPGQKKIRPPFPWRHYFQNIHCLIFVVDRNDNDHVVEARDKLHRVLNELSFAGIFEDPGTSVMLEKKKEYATILAFDVKVTQEARELSDELGVKFRVYIDTIKEEKKEESCSRSSLSLIVPNCVFNMRENI